jgi:signal peptidase I
MKTLREARRSTLFETVFLLVVAIGLAVALQAYAIKPYKIPSGSMEPTLHVGDRVLVNRFAKRILGHDPKIGDVVVFHPPQGADDASAPKCGNDRQGEGTSSPCAQPTAARSSQSFIKRVVGLGGDRLAIKGGRVIRNGKRPDEPFAASCDPSTATCDFPTTITVPRGMVFLMGDNRGNSDDSRFWGPVPEAWVVGKAMATYWPPGRISGGKSDN